MRSSDYTMPSPRVRDRSMDYTLPRSTRSSDFSINGIERMRSRPRVAARGEEEHSQEYKNILARAGSIKDREIMKVARYISGVKDDNLDMFKDLEISDIINNADLSSKTVNAINKVNYILLISLLILNLKFI